MLSVLNVKNNEKLCWLYCERNNIMNLDISHNKKLRDLICDKNVSLHFGENEMRLVGYNCMDEEGEPIDVRYIR